MADSIDNPKVKLFFPYYINQGRLLDIYAILNGGYSEYVEISTAISNEKTKSGKAEVNANGGFKLFNFGGNASASTEKADAKSKENKEKKVQTVTSVLSIVESALSDKGYLRDILQSKPGDFVCLPVVLSINSIKSLLTEMSELLKLSGSMQKIGASVKGAGKSNKDIDDMIKTMQVLFGGEEIIFQTEEFAIVGNIFDSNLYQSVRSDIIGTEMKCLAQVKRVYPNGTELMKNTIFTKIKDTKAKQTIIEAMSKIADGSVFDFEATAVAAIHSKPVYQLEIIALYQ